jgi:hypothetical protein
LLQVGGGEDGFARGARRFAGVAVGAGGVPGRTRSGFEFGVVIWYRAVPTVVGAGLRLDSEVVVAHTVRLEVVWFWCFCSTCWRPR